MCTFDQLPLFKKTMTPQLEFTVQNTYSAYQQIVTIFWEIFENCQVNTLLNWKILQIVTVFWKDYRNDLVVDSVHYSKSYHIANFSGKKFRI